MPTRFIIVLVGLSAFVLSGPASSQDQAPFGREPER
jgi:hypothetical protein